VTSPRPTGSSRITEALANAARRLAEDWGAVREDATSGEEVATHVETLRRGLESFMAGAEAPPADLTSSILDRRLLTRFRTLFVDEVAAQSSLPSNTELLVAFRAFERAEQAIEPEWDRRFTDRLSGPDGLELVVELAHDLRSPLTSILFLAETMKRARSGPVTPLQERQLGLVYSAAFGLSSVASDVIELARGGDRLVDLDPLPFSVIDILESVRDIVQPIAEEKALEVRIQAPARPTRVGHPVALSRVLLNLTTNALKFTDEGHVEVTVSEGEGITLEFSVRDTGRGIPNASLEMLFEPFRRRQRNRDYAFSGSGLGLSICRKLVEAMHSELKVETEADRGTRFYFTLDLPLHEQGSFLKS
jgi:signal transduction histidine kinase